MFRRSGHSFGLLMVPSDLPVDILSLILAQLADRTHLHACALVSKVFNRVATPLLYRTLDARINFKRIVQHPSRILLQRPEYALYVRHVAESGEIHRGTTTEGIKNLTDNTLAALALCGNLESFTWSDYSSTPDPIILSFLAAIPTHNLRGITIRTQSNLGPIVWSELIALSGLRKMSIWCMAGPPRGLQGWSTSFGSSLTELELCVNAYSYPCPELVSHFPKLKYLRLKGAPATAIPTILPSLLGLHSLDTEYPGTFSSHAYPLGPGNCPFRLSQIPALRDLTVRTSSIDTDSQSEKLWAWILDILPHPGLESLEIHAFRTTCGPIIVPNSFIRDLANVQHKTLKEFMVGEVLLMLDEIKFLCTEFPYLETLICGIANSEIAIMDSISAAKNLRALRLHVHRPHKHTETRQFTLQHATDLMLRPNHSKLRNIAVGASRYTGKWILKEPEAGGRKSIRMFEVISDVAKDMWQS